MPTFSATAIEDGDRVARVILDAISGENAVSALFGLLVATAHVIEHIPDPYTTGISKARLLDAVAGEASKYRLPNRVTHVVKTETAG